MAEFMIVEIQSSLWICENAEDRKSNISRINKVEKKSCTVKPIIIKISVEETEAHFPDPGTDQ